LILPLPALVSFSTRSGALSRYCCSQPLFTSCSRGWRCGRWYRQQKYR
jgi:hypothetical protein